VRWNALLLPGDDEEGEDRDHRAVHRHGNRHLIERDAVEQDLHVLDRINRHARLADIADNARVIGIIAAVGGEVEGDREALLAGGEIAAIEGVRFLGGRETGVLADRPGTAGIHRGADSAREGGEARQAGIGLDVVRRVERLDRDALGVFQVRSLPLTSLAAAACQSVTLVSRS